MSDYTRLTALLSGHVQGVGLRRFVQRHALDLGINGSAENLSDGRVEVVAEGWRDDLELLLVRMKMGTAHSDITSMEVSWSESSSLKGFHVW